MTLKALVAKWRGYGEDTRFGHSVYEDCADELEAALTAPSAECTCPQFGCKVHTYQSAETPRGEVTDAMVEAAIGAYYPWHLEDKGAWRPSISSKFGMQIRQSIEAALSSLPKPADVGKADVDEAGSSEPTETPVVEVSGGLKTNAERADRLDYLAGLLDNDAALSHNIELQIAGWLQTYAFELRNRASPPEVKS